MGKVIGPFCWHQNFVPWGLSATAPGLYTCIKSWKKLYKMWLQRHFFLNLEHMNEVTKTFLLISKLCPLGAVCPCPRAIYMYKIMKKNCIKSDFIEIFFETCNKWQKLQDVPVDIIFHSQGVQPLPWGYIYMYKILKKKLYKIRLQRDCLETFSKLLKWKEVSVDIKILSPGVVCPWPAAKYSY